MRKQHVAFVLIGSLAALSTLSANAGTLRRYLDPSQINRIGPWEHSHFAQPWRAYMETVPAWDLLHKKHVGAVFKIPASPAEPTASGLAASRATPNLDILMQWLKHWGFTSIAIETSWANDIDFATLKLKEKRQKYYIRVLKTARENDLRPLIILANDAKDAFCPMLRGTATLTADSKKGTTTVQLKEIKLAGTIVANKTGLCLEGEGRQPFAFITKFDSENNQATISKPLPSDLPATEPDGSPKQYDLVTWKYDPLYPPGTDQFNATIGQHDSAQPTGWLSYVKAILDLVSEIMVNEKDSGFDVQVQQDVEQSMSWTTVNHYFADTPEKFDMEGMLKGPRPPSHPGFLWEWLNRTCAFIKENYPVVRVLSGFNLWAGPAVSSDVADYPPRIDGIMVNPRLGMTGQFPESAVEPGGRVNALFNKDLWCPPYFALFPEAPTCFLQARAESVMHFINPTDRQATPPGTDIFRSFVTLTPSMFVENVTPAQASHLKSKVWLRAALLYLHKGIDGIWWEPDETANDLFNSSLYKLSNYPDKDFQTASQALLAWRRTLNRFVGAVQIDHPRPIDIVNIQEANGPQHILLPGDPRTERSLPNPRPPLAHRDGLVVLPFQVTPSKFVLAVWIMSRDIREDIPDEPITFTVLNVNGEGVQVSNQRGSSAETQASQRSTKSPSVSYYNPHTGQYLNAAVQAFGQSNLIKVSVPVTDFPRLLTIEEGTPPELETPPGNPVRYDDFANSTFKDWNLHHLSGNEPTEAPSMASGKLTLKAVGRASGNANSHDAATYAAQWVHGDFDVRLNVHRVPATNESGRAGIMIRLMDDPESPMAFICATNKFGYRFYWRGSWGLFSRNTGATPYRNFTDGDLRLKRTGNLLTGYCSTDGGKSWIRLGSTRFNLTNSVMLGIAAVADSDREGQAIVSGFRAAHTPSSVTPVQLENADH